MSEMQAQCWICPQCYDDKNHIPGDKHCLQEQKREAMAIARLNQLENRKLQEQLTAAQSENEALRGRAAELESAVGTLRYRIICSMDDKRAAARNWPDDGVDEMLTRSASEDQGVLTKTDYAQRLRQQADEAERAGGGS